MDRLSVASPQHIWERWGTAWRGLFVVLLGVALALTLLDSQAPAGTALPAIISAVVLLAWYIGGEVATGRRYLRTLPHAVYFLCGWFLWYIAVGVSPAFFVLLSVLFPHVFIHLPLRWAVVLAVTLNGFVLFALNRIDSDLTATWMLILAGTSFGGALMALFIDSIIKQSEERQRLIAELEATRATLAQAEYDAGILHERQRLAGELHDTIIQGLVAVVTQLEAAESAHESDGRRHHIERAKAIARADLSEARRFIWMTQTESSDSRLLAENLRGIVADWSGNTAIQARFHVTGDAMTDSIPQQVAHTLARVLQEALANIAKHANAQTVNVTLSWMPDVTLLDINDDGVGFVPSAVVGAGFGLDNMRRRVEALGGELTIESDPNAGATIVAELPLA